MKVYKVRDKETGLFYSSGAFNYPKSWNKKGKTWKASTGPQHLIEGEYNRRRSNDKAYFKRYEVVAYELIETATEVTSADKVLVDLIERKNKREIARERSRRKWEIERAKQQIAEAEKVLARIS